jgi:hypothetical protein
VSYDVALVLERGRIEVLDGVPSSYTLGGSLHRVGEVLEVVGHRLRDRRWAVGGLDKRRDSVDACP